MIQAHHLAPTTQDSKFSILIPSWNNLALLKLCIESIEKHSTYSHQIIVHVNEGKDGTLAWVQAQPHLSYTYSKENIGVCYALNALRTLVRTDYLVFVNDDMFLLPGWDKSFYDEVEKADNDLFFFSATNLEPVFTNNHSVIAPANYGSSEDNFEEDRLLKEYNSFDKEDWSGATWPPNIVATSTWDLVGGYSVEFSPGMYSDPDFSKKLWDAGVRNFKGLSAARSYHFMSKSVGRVKKNNGSKQFLHKWGMTSSTFIKFYLKRGERYQGVLKEPELTPAFKKARLKSKIKKLLSL